MHHLPHSWSNHLFPVTKNTNFPLYLIGSDVPLASQDVEVLNLKRIGIRVGDALIRPGRMESRWTPRGSCYALGYAQFPCTVSNLHLPLYLHNRNLFPPESERRFLRERRFLTSSQFSLLPVSPVQICGLLRSSASWLRSAVHEHGEIKEVLMRRLPR
ncbi:hypothetical protein RHMOL_Rhmol06G0174800 [Rhododendron molle]|uniref:Uncharacterized protein n=1 Tax=Rhododendron molle TaxID=49168 RepID=A0ACC0NEY5_RHOML|nr:hypothetical protein RHMOL_Rhmol06G0174800 [Rhododendron molle]